jgi:PAS domain S-box-containing protein
MTTRKEVNQTEILSLLEKAADSSTEGITIGSMLEEGRPLIYVNKGFEELTGYPVEEVIGQNCRFLQGKDTEPAPVDELRRAIADGEKTTVELLNYKKDGTPFWNRLSITPLKNKDGVATHFVGIQSDITELKETKRNLEEANKGLEEFRDLISKELDQASRAQHFILPAQLPSNEQVKFSVLFSPMGPIGGDYYDVLEIEDNVYGIMIADVTGHGIPAALLTFMTSFAFKEAALGNLSPAKVVRQTNDKLLNKMPTGAFITMFYAIYDANRHVLTYTQAGHPPGFIIRPSTNELVSLQTRGSIVGVFNEEINQFTEKEIALHPGDKMFLYTDAIIEVKNQANQMIESEDFTSFLKQNLHKPLADLFQGLQKFGCDFTSNPTYDDDFTLLGFEVIA